MDCKNLQSTMDFNFTGAGYSATFQISNWPNDGGYDCIKAMKRGTKIRHEQLWDFRSVQR